LIDGTSTSDAAQRTELDGVARLKLIPRIVSQLSLPLPSLRANWVLVTVTCSSAVLASKRGSCDEGSSAEGKDSEDLGKHFELERDRN
jgi:hypothetical protein